MICKNCGSQLPDNSVFCGNCGAQQEQQPVGFGGNIPTPNVPADNNGFNPVPNSPVDNNGFNPGGIPQISVSEEKKGFLQNKRRTKNPSDFLVRLLFYNYLRKSTNNLDSATLHLGRDSRRVNAK